MKDRAPAGWVPVEGSSSWVVQAGEGVGAVRRGLFTSM